MIVVAEDSDVWEKFPIPLINRMEKHYLGMETMLDDKQLMLVNQLKNWTKMFSEVRLQAYQKKMQQFKAQDVFVGFHEDVCASLILRLSQNAELSDEEILEKAKIHLLKCAAPDAIARLSETHLTRAEQEHFCTLYYQTHVQTLGHAIENAFKNAQQSPLLLVTTQSRLLTKDGQDNVQKSLGRPVKILPLQQMNTESQFTEKVEEFLQIRGPKVLLIQAQIRHCDGGSLVDCARYVVQNKISELDYPNANETCIAFVLQVPRIRGGGSFIGIPGFPWQSLHVDELKGDPNRLDLDVIRGKDLYTIMNDNLVNVDRLIEDAIPKAVSKTQTQRVKRRLEILLEAPPDFIEVRNIQCLK